MHSLRYHGVLFCRQYSPHRHFEPPDTYLPALPRVTLHVVLDIALYDVRARFAKRISCEAAGAQVGRRFFTWVEGVDLESLATFVTDKLGAIVVIDVTAVETEALLIEHDWEREDCGAFGL